jgi:hypothetical protein
MRRPAKLIERRLCFGDPFHHLAFASLLEGPAKFWKSKTDRRNCMAPATRAKLLSARNYRLRWSGGRIRNGETALIRSRSLLRSGDGQFDAANGCRSNYTPQEMLLIHFVEDQVDLLFARWITTGCEDDRCCVVVLILDVKEGIAAKDSIFPCRQGPVSGGKLEGHLRFKRLLLRS